MEWNPTTRTFRLTPRDLVIRRQNQRQQVLGLTVNTCLQVNRGYRRALRQELYYLERFGSRCTGAIRCGDYLQYLRALQGKLSYALQVCPEDASLWEAHFRLTRRITDYLYRNP